MCQQFVLWAQGSLLLMSVAIYKALPYSRWPTSLLETKVNYSRAVQELFQVLPSTDPQQETASLRQTALWLPLSTLSHCFVFHGFTEIFNKHSFSFFQTILSCENPIGFMHIHSRFLIEILRWTNFEVANNETTHLCYLDTDSVKTVRLKVD
jgi:hypothetical protein